MIKRSFKFVRGDDSSYRLVFRQKNREPFDVSNMRLDLHVIANGVKEPVIELSSLNGGIDILDNGEVIVHFSHHHTQDATWESGNYDLQLIDLQGKRKTVMYGTVQLIPDYTRV